MEHLCTSRQPEIGATQRSKPHMRSFRLQTGPRQTSKPPSRRDCGVKGAAAQGDAVTQISPLCLTLTNPFTVTSVTVGQPHNRSTPPACERTPSNPQSPPKYTAVEGVPDYMLLTCACRRISRLCPCRVNRVSTTSVQTEKTLLGFSSRHQRGPVMSVQSGSSIF